MTAAVLIPREKSWRSRGALGLAVALGASAVLHALFAVTIQQLPKQRATTNRTAITVSFNPAPRPARESSAEAVVRPHAPARDRPVQPVERPDTPRPDGQVVRLPRTATPEKPPEARHVSEQDHRVEKETRARDTEKQGPVAHERAPELGAPEPPSEKAGAPREHAQHVAGSTASAAPFRGAGWMAMWRAAQEESENGNRGASDNEVESPDEEGTEGTASDEGGGHEEAPRSLFPDERLASKIAGGTPANDALEEVEEGTGTYLNARQWKYASYFNRISEAVRRQWRPDSVLRGKNTPEMRGAVRRRFTLVEITLDRDGRVAAVTVDRFSGNDDLDDEAARAVRAAGPFPNPPTGLFEGADRFSFRFGFTVSFERQGVNVPFAHGLR